MKHRAVAIATLFIAINVYWMPANAQNSLEKADAKCTEIVLEGLKPGQGTLRIAGYTSAEAFFKQIAWGHQAAVTESTMTLKVCGVAAAEIALTAYQDLNNNQKLDSNPLGIPTEPYGASGSPSSFGPPTWADCKVPLLAGGRITVKL
jgi:uncharacterized protein (DUF2141 family)